MLTLEEFDTFEPEKVFWSVTTNLLNRYLPITADKFDHNLLFICRTGYAGDWAIYYGYAWQGFKFVNSDGQKLHISLIPRILPVDPEVIKRYRL
jgi:hypothetical protein